MENILSSNWDFRSDDEKSLCSEYENIGYVIRKGSFASLEKIKKSIISSFNSYTYLNGIASNNPTKLEDAHHYIGSEQSNDLRLHIIKEVGKNIEIYRDYFESSKSTINALCGSELSMQKNFGLSINFPHNKEDILPIHADTWNGVSPFELNIWIPLVDSSKTMCLYILKREDYIRKLNDSPRLLTLDSEELYKQLEPSLTWIEIKYGDILAFDQSLPHGFALNQEPNTHWSLNCRFKGLHTPYWDKKLGEYFIPITVKCATRAGIAYSHPYEWL